MQDDLEPIHAGVSPSLHPETVASLAKKDEALIALLSPVVGAFTAAYRSLGEVHNARAALLTDTTTTADGKTLALADYADKRMTTATRAFDGALRHVDSNIALIEGQLRAPLRVSANQNVVAAEVRAHVKVMTSGQRMEFVKQAIDKGDTETVGAVLGAPAYLSGATDLEREHLTRAWNQRSNPLAASKLDALHKAKAILEEHAPKILTETEKGMGARWTVVQKLRERKASSVRALL